MLAGNKIKATAAFVTLGYLLPLMMVNVPCGKCYCPDICSQPLGISDYGIRDDQLEVGTAFNNDFHSFGAHRARLNLTSWPPGYRANFEPTGTFQWLQVNLDQNRVITGIATQGYGNENVQEWVTSYKVFYQKGKETFPFLTEADGRSLKKFQGNSDPTSIQYHDIPFPVVTSGVILNPITWHNNVGLRMELYGCVPEFHFVSWITVSNVHFSLEYADDKTEAYLSLRRDVITEVTNLLLYVQGFLFADLRTFSPQKVQARSIMAAEVAIYCVESKWKYVAEQLNNSIKIGESSLLSDYLNTEERFNCQCDMPKVVLELEKSLDNAMVVYTNKQFSLRAAFQDNCNTSSDYQLYWEICKCDENTGACDSVIPYGLGWKPERQNKTLFPRLFGGNHYLYIRCVFKKLGHKGSPSIDVKAYSYGYVRLMLPHLVAKVLGPDKVVRGNRTVVHLDASKSYDPDMVHMKTKGMTFQWICKEAEGGSSLVKTAKGITDQAEEKLHGCYNLTSPVLSANLQALKGNRTYIFKIVIQKGGRTTQASHELRVEDPFIFSIRCSSNCGRKVSVNRRVILTTTCTGVQCQRIVKHNWELFQLRATERNDSIEIPNFEDSILTDIDSPNLVIPGGKKRILEENSAYKIRAIVILDNGFEISEKIIFQTNSPPAVTTERGGCSIIPREGFAIITKFNISCSGWNDTERPLSYEFRYETNSGLFVINGGLLPNVTALLPLGNITIEAHISDSLRASSIQRIQVQVKPPPTDRLFDLLESLQGSKSSLTELINRGNFNLAAQMTYSILSVVEETDIDATGKRKLKKSLISQIANIEVNSLQQVAQLSAVVVSATKDVEDLEVSSQRDVVGLLENMTDFVKSQIGCKGSDADLTQDLGGNLLQGISNALSISSTRSSVNGRKAKKTDRPLNEKNRKEDQSQNKEIANRTLQLIDDLGSTLLRTKVVGERPSVFTTAKLTMTLDRQTPAKMSRKSFGEGIVALPSTETLFGQTSGDLQLVDAQMTNFMDNPFTWDDSAKLIQSSVVDFSFKNRSGSILEVSGLNDPVELFIPITREGAKSRNRHDENYFAKPSDGSDNVRYHRINILSTDVLVDLEIKPENGKFFTVLVSPRIKPTPENYQLQFRVPDFSSCSTLNERITYRIESRNCSSNPYKVTLSYQITGKIGVHFIGIIYSGSPASNIRMARSCGGLGKRQKRGCIGVKDPPTTPSPTPKIVVPQYNESTDVNYTMSVKITSCLYWSEKKQAWTNAGCRVGPRANSAILHCLCTHLSAFGGTFFIAPNPIDFDIVWEQFEKLGETGNFIVLATVCIVYGAYFLGLVWARRADKRDEVKVVGNVYLSDVNTNGFLYKLRVQTGIWNNQGTSARVGIALYGDEGCSDTISLSDSTTRKRLFARGSVNNFVFSLPQSLGRILKILVWHDNSGESPSWFLQQVEVEDCSSGEKWQFLVNRWLALEKGSGELQFEINSANANELANFKNLFRFRAARSLGDGHLWLSVFTKPPHVSFTRCQRLSCCVSVLLAAMVTNAMFYNFGAAQKDTFQVGPLKMSWSQIKIGIQSSLIAIPVNILIVMIFRNTRRKNQDHVYKVTTEETDEKAPGFLPHFFVYIGWSLCVLTSLIAAAFIVFYSMMWGKETSGQWLTSITVSFIQDVFVSQPIKVVLLASFLSIFIKRPPKPEKVYGMSFHKENKENEKEAVPLKGKELEEAREFRTKVKAMYKVLSEVTLFLAFVLVLLVLCYGNRGSSRFTLNSSLEESLKDFKGRNISSFWYWMRSKLCPALFDTRWYNGWIFQYNEGFIGNRELFMVGMPRLRQIRIRHTNTCQVAGKVNELAKMFSRCMPPYSSNEYTTLYNLPKWMPVINTSKFQSTFQLETMCPKPWRYRSSWDLKTLPYRGFHNTYGGGGFVADLGYNIQSALNVLQELEENNWIDEFSVAVFIEFTVFNSASSLFSSVKCLYEKFPTGGLEFSKSVKTLTLYEASSNDFQKFFEVCQLLFMVLILFFVLSEVVKIYRQRKRYFLGLWNWLELFQVVTAICAVIIFFLKSKYTTDFVKSVRNNPFETSSADYIILWSDVEIYVLSFLIFMVTLKFLLLIRFNRHVCQMMGTLSRAAEPLVSFLLTFVAAVLAYTQMAFLVFGSTLDPYSSFFRSLRAVLEMLLGGEMFFFQLKSSERILGPLFVFLYMFTMTMIALNMFIAILNESYTEVIDCPRNDLSNADLGSFMIAYLRRNLKLMVKRFTSFLKRPVFKGRRSRHKRSSKRWHKKECKHSSEIDRLFWSEVEKGRIIQTVCPIASACSLVENEQNTEGNDLKCDLRTLADSGNISMSLLSIEELYEAREDKELNALAQDVKEITSSIDWICPIRESIV